MDLLQLFKPARFPLQHYSKSNHVYSEANPTAAIVVNRIKMPKERWRGPYKLDVFLTTKETASTVWPEGT